MNEIEKQIEEMAYVCCRLSNKPLSCSNCMWQKSCDAYENAMKYVEQGYRNCKDKVVLDKKEDQNDFSSQFNKGYEKGSKETAREFAKKLKKVIHERDYVEGYAYLGICEEIDELAKEYGVEVE